MDAISLFTADQIELKLWRLVHSNKKDNVFLTHGTFSNKNICLGIAKYLYENGFNCYILEWRNHGESKKTSMDFNFETIALFDIKVALEYLTEQLKINSFHAVTHSGGGICLSMFLINFPDFQKNIKSITLFSCQAFSVNNSIKNQLKLVLSKQLTQIIGYIPGKKLKLGPENESFYTMKQWFDWNINKNFKGQSIDYKLKMPTIKIPIFSISAENDFFISPVFACKSFLDAFKNPSNIYQCFGKSYNNIENYNHARIIKSKNASKEIYPEVLNWIQKHN